MGQDRPGYTVLFDGDCPICRDAVRRLERWDREERLTFLPAQAQEVPHRFPSLSREALQQSIHLVREDGEIWEGAGALEELVRILPGWDWAAWLIRLPFARPLARVVYRWVARNRYELVCGSHCRPDSREERDQGSS